jgi:hypothetical protein
VLWPRYLPHFLCYRRYLAFAISLNSGGFYPEKHSYPAFTTATHLPLDLDCKLFNCNSLN